MEALKVFISYAHESDDFRESVRQLAIWLKRESKGELEIITDHLFEFRAPPKGWQVWMQDQVEEADSVLIVCSSKYNKRFRKQEEPEKGKGAIFEGAIITQELYDDQLKNDKFHPIIPDEGSYRDVPLILKPFFNYLSFPSKNALILKCILNENPTLEDELVEIAAVQAIEVPLEILETEIVTVMTIDKSEEDSVISSIHELVRAYLGLDDVQKITIAKKLGVYQVEYDVAIPSERDKLIFIQVKLKGLIAELWEEVNQIIQFTNKTNPFKK
jgi:hypothetical protein